MTLKECTAILTPLALALRAEMDAPTFRAYYRALDDVPAALLESAVSAAMRQDSAFMPKPGELRALAEVRRRALIEAHPYERCADCHYIGTVKVGTDHAGRPKYVRCKCWGRYQERLAAMGASDKPIVAELKADGELLLPAGSQLTVDELPAAVADQVKQIARSKVMR